MQSFEIEYDSFALLSNKKCPFLRPLTNAELKIKCFKITYITKYLTICEYYILSNQQYLLKLSNDKINIIKLSNLQNNILTGTRYEMLQC